MMGKYQAECDYQLALLNSNKRIDELEQENAELKRWNANLKTENFKLSQEAATILEHCKDLERIIAESIDCRVCHYWNGKHCIHIAQCREGNLFDASKAPLQAWRTTFKE